MKSKFIEGEIYEFKYVKKVFLEEEYFIFEDLNKERYLLSVYFYNNYGFVLGENISAKILRIDCSGKIFFEPEHAHYKVGSVYEFDFNRIEVSKIDKLIENTGKFKKEKLYVIIVTDIFGEEHVVTPHKWQQKKNFKTDKIKCRIDKIMKGNFFLSNMEPIQSPNNFFLNASKHKLLTLLVKL
ncbi:MAG: hypothetical protein JXR51_09215 [Bacteroidales bacterium]|nr:hypothetical protein [Bacteroidales bacterium]MBN2757343.1 hypothetical protein [Bacteroidales bacterium]